MFIPISLSFNYEGSLLEFVEGNTHKRYNDAKVTPNEMCIKSIKNKHNWMDQGRDVYSNFVDSC